MSADTVQLDTNIEIVTPENITFKYLVAGPFRRLAAWFIDLAIRVGVCFIASMVAGLFSIVPGAGDIGQLLFLLLLFVIIFFYGGLFEAMWNGQTPGKRMMRIRVVTMHGEPINAGQAVLRNVFRFADSLPLTYLTGLVTATMNLRFQRIGDLVSGTMVVVEERPWLYGVTQVNEPEAIRLAGYLPANLEISRSQGRALSAYVSRRRNFAAGRRADIARHMGEPFRQQFGLPIGTSHDLLLCALYYHTFLANTDQDEAQRAAPSAYGQAASDRPPQMIGAARPGPGPIHADEINIVTTGRRYQ
jgi:uncharacterized RDD family membrane protein YckC